MNKYYKLYLTKYIIYILINTYGNSILRKKEFFIKG